MILQELIQYSNDVLECKIIACKKHKWTCERFLKDLDRQGTKDFPYIFKEEKAEKFLKWMTFFEHTKGPLAGTKKIPEPIEKFIFGNVYGWVNKDTEYRRFRKAYWQVGRKNAKSQDQAIVGLYELSAFGEPSSEVYIAATKKEQANYVWEEADNIYKKCTFLIGKLKTSYGIIRHPKSNSKFQRMTKDDKKSGDGGNPQCGIIDEYHAHETAEYYDVLTSGMKTRKQPILMIITTAGFELNNPCYVDEYKYVSDILNPYSEINNDRYFGMINELDMDDEGNLIDDIKDESCWVKPNPILTKTYEGMESLRDEIQVALDKPDKMRDFLTKSMNVWVNQRPCGFIAIDKWKSCAEKKLPDIQGLEVTVGFDLSAVIDLTSVGFEIPLLDGRILVLGHSFMPEETLFRKMKTDKVDYMRWVKEGWISLTPGAEVDYRFMVKYVDDFIEKYSLVEKEFCFDRYMATLLMQELSDEGHTVIQIAQGIPTLGIPTKDFQAKILNKKIIHNNNPVLNWAIGNAVTRRDHNDNIMLDKAKATQRIDPIACLINSHVRVMLNEKPAKSVYESRGIRSL